MPNADRPKGFEPYGEVLNIGKYQAGSAVYPGDAVALASDGQVDPVAAGDGTRCLGVAASYASAAGEDLMVFDHPDQKFVGQADATQIDAQTDIGNTCNFITTAGNSAFQMSRMELDAADIGTTVTAQTRVLGIEEGPSNALGAQVKVVFKINQHELTAGQAV